MNRDDNQPTNGVPPPATGVPELAGVCSYAQAGAGGFGVDDNVARLKRFNWVEQRTVELMLTQITATPEWEVKGGLCYHLWLEAEHARWLQQRVTELRHPPHNFHLAPDPTLDSWLQEALRSRGTVEVLTALYRVIKPALLEAYRAHCAATHRLVDQPTRRILRFMIQEEEESCAWGQAALAALLNSQAAREQADGWESHLRAYLAAAGGIVGDQRPTESAAALPPPSRHRAVAAGLVSPARRAVRKLQLPLPAALGVCAARPAGQ